ncbi:MAG: hypothetical protein OXR68_06200 [Alphaproteobacteria bacterium]|nr:hypothetical protein [Alphaproteobacteria bacterium]MDD9920197.1 hypothetical protein [Alphaproteobacteria bacterium]
MAGEFLTVNDNSAAYFSFHRFVFAASPTNSQFGNAIFMACVAVAVR